MGRGVLITGVRGGIGQALAERFSAAGCFVVGLDLGADSPPHVAAFVEADLAALVHEETVRSAVRASIATALAGRRIEVLVNNAADQRLAPFDRLTIADWQATLDVNVTAAFVLTQMVIADLRASRGCVVNIGSVHARATKRQFVAYATSKAALHGFTRALAVDLGPEVRAVCIAPAAIATPMLVAGFAGQEDQLAELAAAHPLERIGLPEEVAEAAQFVSSPQAAFASGAVFYLDGGVLSRLHDPA